MNKMKFRNLLSFFAALFFVLSVTGAHAAKIITESYESNPGDVPAHDMIFPKSDVFEFKQDGWIIEEIPEVVNGPWRLLHHAWAFNLDRKDGLCPLMPQAIYATGREHIRVVFPEGYGIPVKKGEKWAINTLMLHNDDDVPYKDVRFRLTIKFYVADDGDKPLTSLKGLFLNIGEEPHLFTCMTGATYWVKPGEQIDKWMKPIEVKHDFKIIFIGAHLHDYADYIKLTADDKLVWQSSPILDAKRRILGIPIYLDGNGILVKKGSKLMLETKHTNPTDKKADAMGIIGMAILMDDGVAALEMPKELPPSMKKKDDGDDDAHKHHH